MRFAIWSLRAVLVAGILFAGAGCSSSDAPHTATLVVNSLDDMTQPPAGVVTLRAAVDKAGSGDKISFDPSLNGETILLTIVGEAHSSFTIRKPGTR